MARKTKSSEKTEPEIPQEDAGALGRQIQRLKQERERRLAVNRLANYRPYSKQREFHDAGAKYRERCMLAGNQLGKCVTYQSLMTLSDGSVETFGALYECGEPFWVKSWNGERIVDALATTPIKKPPEPCVRLWFSDGSWIECALNHRLLCADGEYAFVGDLLSAAFAPLPKCGADRQSSILGDGLSSRVADARHCPGRLPDFLAYCLACFRFCDARLHAASTGVRAWLRQRADAPEHSFLCVGSDGCSSIYASSHPEARAHRSSWDAVDRYAGRCAASLAPTVCKFAQRVTLSIQAIQRLLLGLLVPPRSNDEGAWDQVDLQGAYATPGLAGNRIVAYEPIPSQEVYDFSVPATGNYIANGVVHHNTTAGAAEAAMHLTGRYPDWWKGRVFERPIRALAGSESSELTRDGVQRLIIGNPRDESSWGTGLLPKDALIAWSRRNGVSDALDGCVVLWGGGGDVQQGHSSINFKSYDQGRSKWQADTLDWVWLDEEPPMEIYSEALTRVSSTNGMVYSTFTPLLGMSEVCRRFLLEPSPDRTIVTMTIDDAPHYTPEQREKIVAGYPAHEREARAKGIPVLGSGRIFPVMESDIMVEARIFPKEFARIRGFDFGYDHPFAAVELVHDRDGDVVYVTKAFRQREQTPIIHAAAVRSWGHEWVPCAWPHDGLQHDKGSGDQLAAQYRVQHLNMLSERATFSDGGSGVEAGLMTMLDRMQTGRLKVFSHLHEWFEEFRLYHRKDGKVVKEHDDLMSATRYALMMIRYAVTEPVRRVRTQSSGSWQAA